MSRDTLFCSSAVALLRIDFVDEFSPFGGFVALLRSMLRNHPVKHFARSTPKSVKHRSASLPFFRFFEGFFAGFGHAVFVPEIADEPEQPFASQIIGHIDGPADVNDRRVQPLKGFWMLAYRLSEFVERRKASEEILRHRFAPDFRDDAPQ